MSRQPLACLYFVIKKMPLKQGTETRARTRIYHHPLEYKKDAPKAGDGNLCFASSKAFRTTSIKKMPLKQGTETLPCGDYA